MQIKGRGQLAARLAALSGGLVVVPVLLMGVPAEAAELIVKTSARAVLLGFEG